MDESKDDVITLISVFAGNKDKDGFTESEKIRQEEVFACVKSIKRSEFYNAKRAGVDISITFKVNPDDFELANQIEDGKVIAEASKIIFNKKEYKIIRTYKEDELNLELNCERVE